LQEAISYSDSASTVSSAIPAFSKKGDLLIVDEAVCEPVLTGLNLSRSNVQFFRHNDMDHLRTILDSIAKDDRKLRRDAGQQRRFIVVEGLYRNTGDLCPLKEVLKLKEKYCYRLILDESLSFGTIGRTGRGVTEHYGVKTSDVEIITLAMDTSLASVGGVCIGSREIVDHQRLSGAGYCFSASAPPFLSAVAIEALKTMEEEPERLALLMENAHLLRDALEKVKGVTVRAKEVTPVVHLELVNQPATAEEEARLVARISEECVNQGVAIVASKFAIKNATSPLRPSLTLNASTKLNKGEIAKIAAVLTAALRTCNA
jgi:serine palmitoyltransferase